MSVVIILLLMGVLAFANGANDNGKGVATLVGFGAARPRDALIWAALTTAIGAGISFWFSGGLIKSFSTALFADGTALDTSLFTAVLIGAFGWVIIATATGLPVSTTHAITGAIVGAGVVGFGGGQIQWADLWRRFALPLALSPVLSMVCVYAAAWPVLFAVRRWADQCVCVVEWTEGEFAADGMMLATPAAPGVAVVSDSVENCHDAAPVAAITTASAADVIHWTSGGFVVFARGWNDAPKIAALCIGAFTVAGVPHGPVLAFVIVTFAMGVGGLVAGRKVLETLSHKVTPLPLAESLTASVTTASLVSAASWLGLPVSTTHVSTGAIVGAGLKNNPTAVRWWKVGEIALSWLVTLPIAAILAATAMLAISYATA